MRYEFKLPDLAEGMVEGEIVNWLVGVGDTVSEEQPVVEVMTDKATVVISSPKPGGVLQLNYEAGDIAEVGTTLFVLDIEGDGSAEETSEAAPAAAPETETKTAPPAPVAAPRPVSAPAESASAAAGPARVPRGAGKALATPATRRIARELGVDIGQVQGSGPAGRVTADDVKAFAAHGGRTAAPPTALGVGDDDDTPAVTRAPAPAVAPAPRPVRFERPTPGNTEEREERTRIRGLRRAIHEAMSRSKRTAAHFTYVEEVDCENLVAARNRLKPIGERMGVRITYLPFIAKATLLALRYFPKLNASMDDEAGELVLKKYYHLGIAAATPPGLVVPVIKFADQMTLLELAQAINDLGERARTNTLKPNELKGSTFTISSLGKLGGVLATPIINHPEVGIMGVHKLEQRAVVENGAIVARHRMNLSLSFDHRVIDGHEGAEFAQKVKYYLEDPEAMMLEMA